MPGKQPRRNRGVRCIRFVMCLLLRINRNKNDSVLLPVPRKRSSPHLKRAFTVIVPVKNGPNELILAESLAPLSPSSLSRLPIRGHRRQINLFKGIGYVLSELTWITHVE